MKEVEKEVEKDELNPFERALQHRNKHLLPLFVSLPLQLHEECSLQDLQKVLFESIKGESVCQAIKTVLPSWKGTCVLTYTYYFLALFLLLFLHYLVHSLSHTFLHPAQNSSY